MFAMEPSTTDTSLVSGYDETDRSEKLPPQMMQKEKLTVAANEVYKIPLIPLDIGFGIVKETSDAPTVLKDVVRHQSRKQGNCPVTLVFAIRTPGCGGCREHGLQLTEFAASDPSVAVVGVVKECGGNDESLAEFHTHYFRKLPIYKDKKWITFKALGGRKISYFRMLSGMLSLNKRLKAKGINAAHDTGDGWMQGGVLVFDRKGRLRFAIEEVFGKEIDLTVLKRAVEVARIAQKG